MGANQQIPSVPTAGGLVSPPPAGYMPGPHGIAPGQAGGEWWQVPMVGETQMPARQVPGFGRRDAAAGPGHLGARPPMARRVALPVFARRAAIVLAVVLAGFAVGASAGGFEAIEIIGPEYPDDSRRVLAMTLAHLVAGLFWVVAALLLAMRVRAGRVASGVLAAGYLALNVLGRDSLFTIMFNSVIISAGWGDSPLFGDDPGTRLAAVGAVLAALMLVLVLISRLITRGQNHPPGPAPIGYGHHGHVDGRPGPATPPYHPYR
ncbi:hypothetical protein [Nocardia neocaledoniensis]|uniref:hypothetical protein n=1 Tax=Nocardia neocaledoniensis TaxID=236511 RepID=UPI002457F1B5|nr:hypothetical protein [Nocardia neocaledoniensis]